MHEQADSTPVDMRRRDRYPRETMAIAVALLDNLPKHTMRIVEEVHLASGSHRCEVTMDLQLPVTGDAAEGIRLVPFLVLDRGQSLDNFGLVSGGDVSILSRWEAEELYQALLYARFEEAFHHLRVDGKYPLAVLQERRALLDVPGSADVAGVLHSLDQLERNFGPNDPYAFAQLASLCKTLARVYFLVAAIPAPSPRILIKYSYDRPHTDLEQVSNLQLRLRSFVGQKPYHFTVPVPLCGRTDSYHFRMRAPAGFYARSARFCRYAPLAVTRKAPKRRQSLFPDLENDLKPPLRSSALGLPYVHLYMPRGSLRDTGDAQVRLLFLEVPPGTLGLSTLLNGILTGLLLLFAFFIGQLVERDVASDVPLVILGLPAAAVLWLQSTLAEIDQTRGSLTARLGMYLNGTISVTASLLYLWGRVAHPHHWLPILWWLLTALAASVTIFQGRALRRSFKFYAKTLDT